MKMRFYKYDLGFSLIELMIVVAIVAILAGVAYPSYQQYVKRTYRSTSQADLVKFAQAMEKGFVNRFTYEGMGTVANGVTQNVNGPPAAGVFPTQIPVDSSTKYYNVTISGATNSAFTVVATPIAGTVMAGDGSFTLTNTGVRRWDRNNDGDYTDADDLCWESSGC